MRVRMARAAWTVPLVGLLVCAPDGAHAQVEAPPRGGWQLVENGPPFLDGRGPSFGDRYLLETMALSLPSTVISAVNLRAERPGSLWLGLAGIGMGVGHGALFVAGVREAETPGRSAVWWNAIASAYSTVSGILQIRKTIGDGPESSSLRASITPGVDGVRLRVTWKR